MVAVMARLRGIWLELRVIPVLLWSFSAITLGTALAADGGTLHGWYYLGAVTLGLLIQGLIAHCVNELEDWRSGTDRHDSPRVISGGSKVLVAGLLTTRPQVEPFPSAFHRAFAAKVVRGALSSGRRALHALLDEPLIRSVPAPTEWPRETWTNLNRPEDLDALGATCR